MDLRNLKLDGAPIQSPPESASPPSRHKRLSVDVPPNPPLGVTPSAYAPSPAPSPSPSPPSARSQAHAGLPSDPKLRPPEDNPVAAYWLVSGPGRKPTRTVSPSPTVPRFSNAPELPVLTDFDTFNPFAEPSRAVSPPAPLSSLPPSPGLDPVERKERPPSHRSVSVFEGVEPHARRPNYTPDLSYFNPFEAQPTPKQPAHSVSSPSLFSSTPSSSALRSVPHPALSPVPGPLSQTVSELRDARADSLTSSTPPAAALRRPFGRKPLDPNSPASPALQPLTTSLSPISLAHSDQSDTCAVCLDSASPTDLKLMPCAHIFHVKCILPWVSQNFSCPLCRTQIKLFLPTDSLMGKDVDEHGRRIRLRTQREIEESARSLAELTEAWENNFLRGKKEQSLGERLVDDTVKKQHTASVEQALTAPESMTAEERRETISMAALFEALDLFQPAPSAHSHSPSPAAPDPNLRLMLDSVPPCTAADAYARTMVVRSRSGESPVTIEEGLPLRSRMLPTRSRSTGTDTLLSILASPRAGTPGARKARSRSPARQPGQRVRTLHVGQRSGGIRRSVSAQSSLAELAAAAEADDDSPSLARGSLRPPAMPMLPPGAVLAPGVAHLFHQLVSTQPLPLPLAAHTRHPRHHVDIDDIYAEPEDPFSHALTPAPRVRTAGLPLLHGQLGWHHSVVPRPLHGASASDFTSFLMAGGVAGITTYTLTHGGVAALSSVSSSLSHAFSGGAGASLFGQALRLGVTPSAQVVPTAAVYFAGYEHLKRVLGVDTDEQSPMAQAVGFTVAATVASAVANAPSLARNPVLPLQVGTQFGVFESVKREMAEQHYRTPTGLKGDSAGVPHREAQRHLSCGQVFTAAAAGGVAGCTVTYPLAQYLNGTLTVDSGMLRGWARAVTRMMPACTCTAVAYHYASQAFHDKMHTTARDRDGKHHF